jgi:hypothetical protein
MRWRRTRCGLRWGLAVVAAAVAVLCPLTRWLKGQWISPATNPTLAVVMAGETVVFRYQGAGFGPGIAPSQFWWDGGPVKWSIWFHFQSYPDQTQLVIPMWPFAVVPGIGALLLWRGELPERRRRLGLCAGCGYDRRGLEAGAACPECGAAITN